MRQRIVDREQLARELASLPELTTEALHARWRELYRIEPPPYLNPRLLRAAIAYRLQVRVLGGLKPATRRLLRRVAEDADAAKRSGRPVHVPTTIKPGTRLLRTWQGVTHEVLAIDDGFRHQGRRYRSLSAIARAITGQPWSGPLFFGLKPRCQT